MQIIIALAFTTVLALIGLGYIGWDNRDHIGEGIISLGEKIVVDRINAQATWKPQDF